MKSREELKLEIMTQLLMSKVRGRTTVFNSEVDDVEKLTELLMLKSKEWDHYIRYE